MDSLDVDRVDRVDSCASGSGSGSVRGMSRSALGPGVGESSGDDHDDAPPRNFSRSSYVIDDTGEDDLDDEITAVFNDDNEDCMSKSWHGSRSSSQRSLAFFVDFNAADAGHPQGKKYISKTKFIRTFSFKKINFYHTTVFIIKIESYN